MVEFDWVTEISKCSPAKKFEELKAQVKRDIATRNSLRPQGVLFKFEFAEDGASFTAIFETNRTADYRSVTFQLEDKSISVGSNVRGKMFDVVFTLNNLGQCVPKVKGTELEFWQVRQQALEDLFRGA